MRLQSIASSSSGNAYVVSDGKTRILIECGLSYKKLQKALGGSLMGIDGCLLSHDHGDHSKSITDLLSRGYKCYMSEGTADALGVDSAIIVEHMEQFSIGTMDVVPFDTFHDCQEPLGFLIKSRVDGDILVFATDTVNLRYKFPGLNILAIEANYDKQILDRSVKLPEKVRKRITNSHMDIDTLCDYLLNLDLSDCREIYLLHLSDSHSHEARFVSKVASVVPDGIRVTACKK